jgi:hypothetical protein
MQDEDRSGFKGLLDPTEHAMRTGKATGNRMSLRATLHRRRLAQLNQIEVASPCHVPWEQMAGDEKVRFCEACQLHVYNLSAMDAEEAAERISQDDGRLCVRFYRRTDGTLLTQDCPVGVEAARRRRRHLLQDTAATLAGAGLVAALLMPTQGAVARPAARLAALRSAARSGDVDFLRKLLDGGGDPDSPSGTGVTLLMLAAAGGQEEAVRLLLARGADVHARSEDGRTALKLAQEGEHAEVAALLRRLGATE